uniref:Uncharacterized protein n=1 Tax=Arion vulgaris TaxID=1028688 RepID=A0A0B7A2T4_9EUPU
MTWSMKGKFETMKKMRSLIFGSLAAASENMGASTGASETVTDQETREITVLNATPVDPKVAEFFKDFPQPYREKAIQRFSSRDGLYRWDFYRDSQMQQEINAALQGIFLEDKREADELEIQKAEQDRLNDYEERKRNFKDRDIPEWEQQSLKFIPLQPGDRMSRKLLQSGSCALTGVLSLGMAVSAIRQKSSKTRRQDILCGLTLFCCKYFANCFTIDVPKYTQRQKWERF